MDVTNRGFGLYRLRYMDPTLSAFPFGLLALFSSRFFEILFLLDCADIDVYKSIGISRVLLALPNDPAFGSQEVPCLDHAGPRQAADLLPDCLIGDKGNLGATVQVLQNADSH